MFYWLVYYNGFEIPKIEAGFSSPVSLCRYVNRFNCSDVVSQYTVLVPNADAVSLQNFYDNYKEF